MAVASPFLAFSALRAVKLENAGVVVNTTELTKYVWQVKRRNEKFHIDWVTCTRANAYTNRGKRWSLCLTEKLCLTNADRRTTLNKRSELAAKCDMKISFTYATSREP